MDKEPEKDRERMVNISSTPKRNPSHGADFAKATLWIPASTSRWPINAGLFYKASVQKTADAQRVSL